MYQYKLPNQLVRLTKQCCYYASVHDAYDELKKVRYIEHCVYICFSSGRAGILIILAHCAACFT